MSASIATASTGTSATTLASAASTAVTTSGNTGDLSVASVRRLAVDVNVTAVSGTIPSCAFVLERKGADGIYYPIASPAALTAAGTVILSVGAGLSTAASFGATVRLKWTITGTTPSFTFSYSIVGK